MLSLGEEGEGLWGAAQFVRESDRLRRFKCEMCTALAGCGDLLVVN